MTPVLVMPVVIVIIAFGFIASRQRECQRLLIATSDDIDEEYDEESGQKTTIRHEAGL